MSAGTISVYQKAAQSIDVHFTDANAADINITGKTVYLYVAQGIDQPNLITKTVSIHTDATHGKSNIALTSDDTDLDARGFYYEIWLDDTPSDTGTFIVKDTLRG